MIKKSFAIFSISAAFYVQAQDASVIRNSIDVYTNPNLTGSSKYNAMAGSMGALGGDVSVLNSNPAGIGVAIASDLSGTLNINNTVNKSNLNGTDFEYKLKNTDLGHVGGVAVFETRKNSPWKFINLGVSYSNKSADDYVETRDTSGSIVYDLPNNETLTFNRHAYDRKGNISKMSLGLGGNYDNRIYVGGGLNLHTATITQEDNAQLTFGSKGTSELFRKQYTPYLENTSGFSASVGVIGKVNKQFRLGAAIETPTWWTMDRLYKFYGHDGGNDAEYSETRSFASPMKATLSAAFVPSKNLALNVDYSLGLSKPKFGKMDTAAQKEMDNFINSNYKNISEIRIGGEYRMDQFRLRAGYALATSPFGDAISFPVINSGDASVGNLYAGKKQTLGLGLGYDFKSFYIDAAYNKVNSKYNNPFLRGSSDARTEYYSSSVYFAGNSAVSEVENNQNNMTLTLGWKF